MYTMRVSPCPAVTPPCSRLPPRTLQYYPIFVVALQLALIAYNREAGPMLYAERRAKVLGSCGAGGGGGSWGLEGRCN